MFLTMCHGTWNSLSEVRILRPFLHNWREDNYWLHTIGGWTMGGLTIAHVWSLMLPSLFHGYANRAIPGQIDFPAQVRARPVPPRRSRHGRRKNLDGVSLRSRSPGRSAERPRLLCLRAAVAS